MKIKEVKIQEPFKGLFRLYDDVYKEVLDDIRKNGYDENEPILLWERDNILIDGHTRLKAAKEEGLKDIPASLLTFENEDEALRYAIKRNSQRRFVSMGDKFRCVRLLDEVGSHGGDRHSKGFKTKTLVLKDEGSKEYKDSASRTAKLVNISGVQVTKMRTILNYANEETITAVEDDEISIDAAWKDAKKVKEKIEEERKNAGQFNKTNDSIEWALWTWNPVTGCKHGCKYCYARDIANRFFEEKFEPTFHENRILAPSINKIPEEDEVGEHNVFVCSMADLFGEWVEDEWIEKIFKAIEDSPKWWNFIFLTKNPKRYLKLKFPKRCWIGATGDTQKRVDIALNVFTEMKKKGIKNKLFLSCEPLMEDITIGRKPSIDWIIIGGRSKSTGMEAGQPEWEWVEKLLIESNEAGLPCYWKPNLTVRPKEYPTI